MLAAVLATAAALLTSVHDVFPHGDAHSELRRVHPVTLAPAGAPVRLDGFLRGGFARSPDGGRLALGVTDRGRVQIVTGRSSRIVRTGHRTAYGLLAWPRADRIVALGYFGEAAAPYVVIEPSSGRVLRSAQLTGRVSAGEVTPDGLALLVSAPGQIADASLALIDGDGNERRIALPGVPAGFVAPDADGVAREVAPDVTVRDGRAYIATDDRIVEVDLATGAQTAHVIAGPRARAAKRADGNQRQIGFVGPHQLAVSGVDLGERLRPAGLRVVDTRTWSVQVANERGHGFVALPGGGLAAWPTTRGLVLLDAEGRQRLTALRNRAVVRVQAAGRYAYATTMRPKHRTFVVELSSGRVVKTLPTAQPGRLLG